MVHGPIAEEELPQIKRNPWADNFFRPLLITVMIMCFNISLVNLARLFNPAWRSIYFLGGMLLVTVEAIYAYRALKRRPRDTSVFRYRIAEWVLIIIVLKLFSFADKPLSFIWANLQATWWEPLNAINLEFYVMLVLAFVSWLAATETIADFEALYDPYTFRSSRNMPQERLVVRFFWGGIILVAVSGVTQLILKLGVSSLFDFNRPSLGGVLVNVLIYFALGFVLLSQANLTRLMMRWRSQKIEVTAGLRKRWAWHALIFLGLITVLVFFLPTSYTLGFLTSAGIVVGYVMEFFTGLLQLLILLFTLPLVWLMQLLGIQAEPLPTDEMPPPLPRTAPQTPPFFPWLDVLRSLMFWLVALFIMGAFIRIYFTEHPELLAALKKFRPVELALNFINWLWTSLRALGQTSVEVIRDIVQLPGRRGEAKRVTGSWSRFQLGRLTARERILYYYLNTLKRAEKRKLTRKVHETPYEYEPNLEQAVPDVETEVQELTDIFVRARYSREGFNEEQAGLVKQQWQRIRRALRRSQTKK